MKKNAQKILILGIGNDILSDDAIGPKLVKRLKAELQLNEVSFCSLAKGGMEIIEFISDYEKVVLIDAIRTNEMDPGTVFHMTPDDFQETLHLSSFHDMSFLTALEFAKRMNMQVPNQIDIIAIEIVEDLTFSDDFSPIIANKSEQIYKDVSLLVQKLIDV